jgi:hypothetical protein
MCGYSALAAAEAAPPIGTYVYIHIREIRDGDDPQGVTEKGA